MTKHLRFGHAIIPVLILILLVTITSCRSYRKVIKEPLKTHGTEFLIEQMKEHEIKTGYFTARFSAELTRNRDRMSFNGQIRVKRDSIIWLTFSPALGIEMGRLVVTNDSVKWMNRLESNYLLAGSKHIASLTHPLLNYDLLQAIIFGNDLTLYDNSQFRGGIDNKEYKLSVSHRRNLKKQMKEDEHIETIPFQHLWLDPETFRITRVMIRDLQDKDAGIDVEYQRFVEVNGFLFASRQLYNIRGGGNKLDLVINFSRIDTPETAGFPFTIPEKYSPINN